MTPSPSISFSCGSASVPPRVAPPPRAARLPWLAGATLLLLTVLPRLAGAQDIADRFNRADNNAVGNSWTEIEVAAAGARIVGNELRLARTSNANNRQYVTKNTPGTYSTTLSGNNCTLTWAFSFRQTEDQAELSGFDAGDDGMAVVLAGSNADLTLGTGYAVVLGEAGNTDELRLVRYNGGLDADANLTDILTAGDFATEYLDVRVTYVPSTNTWSLFYRSGATLFNDPLTAATAAGSAVNNTYTGTALPIIGLLWNHDGDNTQFAEFDNFYIPSGRPTAPTVTPASATICSAVATTLTASTASTSTTRVTFSSTGGPSAVTTAISDGSVYPWNIAVSGLPTTGVSVESVTLNGITHTYPDDLDILLQSPTGTNVTLMSDVGAGTDILNYAYTFMDGSPAMADAATNVPGLYACTNASGTADDYPTSPGPGNGFTDATPLLSAFSANPNGNWKLLIRDNAAQDAGSVLSWSITLTYTSTVTYSWSPGTGLNSTTTAAVQAGPSATTTYTVTGGHSANACTQNGTVTVTTVTPPTTATVGGAKTICANGTTTGLGGNTPSVGTGAWSVVSGGTGTFSSTSTPNATFTHTGGAGPVIVRWTITGTAPCAASSADVTVTINQPASATISYPATPYCNNAGSIAVNRTGTAGGTYTSTGGLSLDASTGAVNAGTSTAGSYTVTYTVAASGGCPQFQTTAGITITTLPAATISYTGSPYCNTFGSATVTRSGTSGGTFSASPAGLSINSGTGTVTRNTSTPGTYTVTLTFAAAGGCAQVQTTASITITANPSANIAYPFASYCQTAGTVNVNLTGTTGGTYTASPAGLSINSSTGTVDLALSTTQAYTVTYTVAAAGGCAQFQTTTGLTITAPPNRYHDTDGDGFGDPNDFIASCTPVIGYVSDNTDDCPTLAGKQGDSCNDGNANTTGDIITPACVCAGTNSAWYSQGNGTFADPIWSHNVNGPGAMATINSGSIVVIKTGHTVTLAGTQDVSTITVQNGGTLGLGSATMTVHGTTVQVDGTLNGGTGVLVMSAATSTLGGSGTVNLYDLTINASTGVTCSANASIHGTLLLSNGVFTASGTVQLASDATGTGRLGPVAPTASYSGNLKVNRFIPAGKTNWRMMGSPVSGQTVNEWKDDFITAGFPGSHAPNFSNPTGSGILWPSVRWYNETNPGASINAGLVGATNVSQSLAAGQGFAAWSGSGFTSTTAFTVDMTGAPNVAQTAITLPMTYTNTGVPATDGWNMVSNPLPSPIAFDLIGRGANVEDYITYFDPATGNNATYDISQGVGTNGGTNVIQSSQAFWLKANGAAVTTTVDENDKVSGNGGGFFGGSQIQTTDMVRLRINSAINQFSDETVVVFNNGQPGMDGDDVPKFIFAHPDAPQIATQGDGGELIAINAYGAYTVDITIPVTVDVAISGDYTITATGLAQSGLTCLRLEDLETNTVTPLVEGTSYTFTALSGDDMAQARFVLHASAPLQLTATDATCHGRDDGHASVDLTSTADVVWSSAGGAVLLEQNAVNGPTGIVALEAGEYTVSITSTEGCGALSTLFTIEEPGDLEVTAVAEPTSCPATEDGTIDVEVLGGVAPYTFDWSNNATGAHVDVAAGTYTVLITDANGCTMAPQEYLVSAGDGPFADISLESGTVMVGEDVLFVGSTSEGVSHTWDFGDGTTSTELEPVHNYTEPGSYTITLTVDDGNCTNTTSLVLFVETTTSLPTIVGSTLNAYVSGDFIVVDHNFNSDQPVIIRVFSAGGQLAQEHKVAAAPARITLPTAELATGIWLVRVSNGNNAKTFSLPVAH
ncbi:MAG: proprotein convertase P-domain-containing protein [Flavobacteriales bacterium]|nr:proprotein convertase P-domain-containing protein [Flavobacteriales bacterium]